MKIKNRIMSWVLSPGAYAVWHALGNSEEWEVEAERLKHKRADVRLFVLNCYHEDAPPAVVAFPVTCIVSGFLFDCAGKDKGAIGYLERHLIAPRAYRVMRQLARVGDRRKKNRNVFTKLTVNQVAE